MWRVLLMLLLVLPTWFGAGAVRAAEVGELSVAAVSTESGCGCGGTCGMVDCGCAARSSDPSPIEREPVVPGVRESKPIVLAMPREASRPVVIAGAGSVAGVVRRVGGPHYSYDSVQAYLCIWRS